MAKSMFGHKRGWSPAQVLAARSLAEVRSHLRRDECADAFDALYAAGVHVGMHEGLTAPRAVRGTRGDLGVWRAKKQIRSDFLRKCVR